MKNYEKIETEQLNMRVPKPCKRVVKAVANMRGVKLERMILDVFRVYFLIADDVTEANRQESIRAFKKLGGDKLGFKSPLTPEPVPFAA